MVVSDEEAAAGASWEGGGGGAGLADPAETPFPTRGGAGDAFAEEDVEERAGAVDAAEIARATPFIAD